MSQEEQQAFEQEIQPLKKLYLLNKLLELFKGTIFRQTMFAEFEKNMAEDHEKGIVLTTKKDKQGKSFSFEDIDKAKVIINFKKK